MYLIVGLGNPGIQYQKNRHNVGYLFVDMIRQHFGFSVRKSHKKFLGCVSEGIIDNHKCVLLKPETYMNLSGQSVQALLSFYKIPIQNILVIHDEIDLNREVIQLKKGGSHAGHNGLRDIILRLGSADFSRIRVGVGRPVSQNEVANYVLSDFSPSQLEQLSDMKHDVIKHIKIFLPPIL